VTGAAGFIGSRVAKALLARGDQVLGLDNFDPYYDRAHKERHLRDLRDETRFRLLEIDLRDAAKVRELCAVERPEAIVHLAAMAAVRYSVRHPLLYGEVNVQGTLNLLDAARQNGRPRCVLASTGSVYGRDTPVPFREDAPAVQPLAPYPASKRAMEIFAHSFAHGYALPITVARFFNVYGPHGRPDMMPWQWTMSIAQGKAITLFDGGRLKRDWTYIDDIVAGLIAAVDAGLSWEILNLGGGQPIENLAFVRVLEKLLNRKAIIEDVPSPISEPFETWASLDKARAMLNYEPQVAVEQGLKYFVDWLRAQKLLEA
jgi:UDP-glucuronate 4-epimerase